MPPKEVAKYFTKSSINSAFSDKIEIYKLKPRKEFFGSLKSQKNDIEINRGFCRTLYFTKRDLTLSQLSKETRHYCLFFTYNVIIIFVRNSLCLKLKNLSNKFYLTLQVPQIGINAILKIYVLKASFEIL